MKNKLKPISVRLKEIDKTKREYGDESRVYTTFAINTLIEIVQELNEQVEILKIKSTTN